MGRNRYFKRMTIHAGLIMMAIVYVLIMSWLLFFRQRYMGTGYAYNIVPFDTIRNYIEQYHHYNFDTWFKNLFGNIVLFIPIGIFLPLFHARFRNVFLLAFTCIVIIAAVEVTQMLTRVGSFDVDDIILNTFGALIGLFISRVMFPLRK